MTAEPVAAQTAITIRIVDSVARVPAHEWDACVLGDAQGSLPHPFVCHAFLLALEVSGCTTPRTGWTIMHVLVEDTSGHLLGVCPCFLKTHSQGEYVFDHAWAEAYARIGGAYYPKLQISAPFSPVTGPRLLVRASPQAAMTRAALIQGLKSLREKIEASSIHATFLEENDCSAFKNDGFLIRTDQQFHWQNNGYETFEGFLAALSSRKRKMIRKERTTAVSAGISIECLSGDALRETHWDDFFAFYLDTSNRKWGRPYLTRDFFSQVGRSMADQILLVMAKRDGRFIAGAINFIGDGVLYGRNWGCIEDHPCLHFEICYYQAIAFAISNKLSRVEAGAQGEHKLARGYLPVTTYSAHHIADVRLRRAVSDYLQQEQLHVAEMQEALLAEAPFRKVEIPS